MKNDQTNSSKKHRELSGLVAAPFTPLRADKTLNLALISQYASWLADNGVSAVFICGTTGEGFSLTTDERRHLAEAWMAGLARLAS